MHEKLFLAFAHAQEKIFKETTTTIANKQSVVIMIV